MLFLIFGSSEQIVRSKAQLSSENIRTIQIPIDASIKENKLKENLSVKKGDVLMVFDTDGLSKQKKQISAEITTLIDQNKGLELLIRSLEEEKNLFSEDDRFGYSNQVNAFLKGKEQVKQSIQQIQETYQNNVKNIEKNRYQLDEQIDKNQSELQELKQMRNSWINQQTIQSYSDAHMAQYNLWQLQLEQAQEMDKKQVKATILTEIDKLISQLSQTIDQLNLQKEVIASPTIPTGEVNSQLSTIDQTKEQLIAAAKEQQKTIMTEKEKSEVALKSIEDELEKGKIKSTIDGTVHLDSAYEKTKNIPKGTVVAKIFPKIDKNKMEFVSQISADEIANIKKGMSVHMKIDKKGNSNQPLNGYLTEISETSTNTEQGAFFMVKGIVTVPKNTPLRYGLVGDLSLVVGKQTYWTQLINFMFNRN